MSQERRTELAGVIQALQAELAAAGLWGATPPPTSALESREPFCVDTLSFDDWLQWVLIPRLQQLLIHDLPLPGNCAIAPMAEEVWREQAGDLETLLAQIRRLDRLLNR